MLLLSTDDILESILGPDTSLGSSQFIESFLEMVARCLQSTRSPSKSLFRCNFCDFLVKVIRISFEKAVVLAVQILKDLILRLDEETYLQFMTVSEDGVKDPSGRNLIDGMLSKLEHSSTSTIKEILQLLETMFEFETQRNAYGMYRSRMNEEGIKEKPAIEYVQTHPDVQVFETHCQHANKEVSEKCYTLIKDYLTHDI